MRAFSPSQDTLRLDPEQRIGAKALPKVLGDLSMALVAGFLIITTFEGALRYYSVRAGAPWLIYIKDVMVLGALAVGTIVTLLTNIRNAPFFFVLIFLSVGTVVGGSILPDIRQPLFAVKTLLPLLCGTAIGSSIDIEAKFFRYTCIVLLLAAIGGVLLTLQWHAPWVGFEYEVGGKTVESSREWSIGGVDRVAGFSRSSFDAALQCVFLSILVVMGTRYYIVSLVIWLLSGAAIYLTTTRSAAAGLVVAMGLHVLVIASRATQWLAKISIVLLAVAVAALPFAAAQYYKNKAISTEATNVASTSSFEERSTKTWPDAFALQKRGGNLVLGRGLGGIGAAQKFYEPAIFSPGDNFFVYIWVAGGGLGLLFFIFIPFLVCRSRVPMTKNRQAGTVMVGAFLAVGLTLNGIESAISSLFLGMALAWLAQRPSDEEIFGYDTN